MNPFPEKHELISFFSQEPEVLATDAPWFYNTLKFSGQHREASYFVKMSPAYGELELRIAHKDALTVHLVITRVAGLTIHENLHEALMMATFTPGEWRGLLKFRLRPHLQIEWPFEKV